MSSSECARVLDAELRGEDVAVNGLSIDSRTLQPGQLFVALRGPRFDGHKFVSDAHASGAAASLVEHSVADALPQIIVRDSRHALGALSSVWRQRFALPVVAVTGSNGKTTVKEMLASILATLGPTLATQGNLNNDIGVPLTLARLTEQHRSAVVELGANHPGEIAYLARLVRPTVALVTNAGPAHLEGFGSLEGVAGAKGEIYGALGEDGTAIINSDDSFASLWQRLAGNHTQITFGLDSVADVHAQYELEARGTRVRLFTPIGEAALNLQLAGRHNVMNALAASAAAIALGCSLEQIATGLQRIAPVKGRLQVKRGVRGSCVIDDTYNANPESLRAALHVLKGFPGRHFLALGDMAELGRNAQESHVEAGKAAREAGVERLYAVGDLARAAVESFGGRANHFASKHALASQLRDDLDADVAVLVKGSRGMGMEEVVEVIAEAAGR
ncbi:MAG: hypothetical protein AMS22_02595 [Thiotrichales bacterium SG8_50]|nr:MAG: hypothetical protein AMS22_02595 [Thiotrichales bacterium SG8_50]